MSHSKSITTESNKSLKKILVVGDGGVGKTCLINTCFKYDDFEKKYKPTFGIDVHKKNNYIICDFPGQEVFSQNCQDLGNINLCIIMYDVTNKLSYKNVNQWKKKVLDECGAEKFIIIGNKIDHNDQKINDENTINISIKQELNILRVLQEIDCI